MKLTHLTPAFFVSRPNRFVAVVAIDGQETLAHVPNSGRLAELLAPGRAVLLAPRVAVGRKTVYDLTLVRIEAGLASADARLPSKLVVEALADGKLHPFAGYASIHAESSFGGSRLDLRLDSPDGACLIEVKSITLVVNGVALFPTAQRSGASATWPPWQRRGWRGTVRP